MWYSNSIPRTGRPGDEKILSPMHEIKSCKAFHLAAVQPPVCGIVDLLKIGLVPECDIPGKLCYGRLCSVVPFACKEHGEENVRGNGLQSGACKTFLESLCHIV